METREILIANTRTQKKYKMQTNASTMRELKDAMTANQDVLVFNNGEWVPNNTPIDYEGLAFTEGISNTELLDDTTQLPRNLQYKGTTTNSLVILLTNTKNKIASGASLREEAYAYITENHLQEDVKEEFGRNYTNVSTVDLWDFIEATKDQVQEDEDFDEDDEEENVDFDDIVFNNQNEGPKAHDLLEQLTRLISALLAQEVFTLEDVQIFCNEINNIIASHKELFNVGNVAITGNDIDSMIAKK